MGRDMDGCLILKGSIEDVYSDLAAINMIAEAYWIQEGYTVIDGVLIGKDGTGKDRPDAIHTTTWDEPRKAPDGEYWIYSPSNEKRFSLWKDRLAEVGYSVKSQEIERPVGYF